MDFSVLYEAILVSIDAKLGLDTEELMSETSSAVYKVRPLVSLIG